MAARRKVVAIEVKDSKVMLTRGGDYLLIGDRFPRLTSSEGENNLASLAIALKSTFLTILMPSKLLFYLVTRHRVLHVRRIRGRRA